MGVEDTMMEQFMLFRITEINGTEYYHDIAWNVYEMRQGQAYPRFSVDPPDVVKSYIKLRKEQSIQKNIEIQ